MWGNWKEGIRTMAWSIEVFSSAGEATVPSTSTKAGPSSEV